MSDERPHFVLSEQPAWLDGVPGGSDSIMALSTGARVLVPTASTLTRSDSPQGLRNLLPDWLTRALARLVADELLMCTNAAAPVVSVAVGRNYGVRESPLPAAQLPEFCADFNGDAVVSMHLEVAQRGPEHHGAAWPPASAAGATAWGQPNLTVVGALSVDVWDARERRGTHWEQIPDDQWSMVGATVASTLGLDVLPQRRLTYRIPRYLRNEYLLTSADMLSLGLCTSGVLDPDFVQGEVIAQRIMAMWPRDISQYPQLRWMLGAMVPWLERHPSARTAGLLVQTAQFLARPG